MKQKRYTDEQIALAIPACLADALTQAGLRVIRVPDRLRSHLVAADMPGGSAEALHHHFAGLGIRCSYRKGGLRLSVHGYTDEEEVDRTGEACSRWLDAPLAGTPRDAMSPSRWRCAGRGARGFVLCRWRVHHSASDAARTSHAGGVPANMPVAAASTQAARPAKRTRWPVRAGP